MLVRRLLIAVTVAAAAVGVLVTSTAATAAGSKCVALVVDFSHVGGSVSSTCVTAPTSATGSDVLVAGHHKVTFDPRYGNDFVCAIDGVPAGGCHATDNTHYWVYYHRAPGSTAWHVSQEGAGTYKPANTATEGWVYDNGASSAPTPRDVPYKSICTKSSPSGPPPSASPTPAHTQPRSTLPTHHATTRPASPRSVVASTAAATPTLSASPTATSPPPPTATPATSLVAHRHATHRVPLGLVIALIAAAALGVAAVLRLRRSSG